MIIPIGVDCGMAMFCKKYNLRNLSFPFDWVVSYNGVSNCIDDNFTYFIPQINEKLNNYDMFFTHDFAIDTFSEDKIKYTRRYNRFINILKTSKENIIFCRKGHAGHLHNEHNGKYCNITSDISDAENLDAVISNKYPELNYKIIVILVCGKCFDANKIYKSQSDKIEIYNIATPQADDELFENCARNIFKV
jgi:hypothetical protein